MKVVGIGKTHISTKNRVKIRKFAIELAQTMITLCRKSSELLLGAIFCE
jgi:hypothetical protein